jgi:hypothetical protein
MVFSMIHLQLSNNVLRECLDQKFVDALWLKLESICMLKDLTSKMHIKMKLFMHKLQEGGSILTHILVFKEIVADLTSMHKFDDEDLSLFLLCSLPTSFSNFRDTILYSHDTQKMRHMVNSEDATSMNGEALHVFGHTKQNKSNLSGKGNNNQRSHSKSKGLSGDLFCRYCKRKNHVIENCWKLQNKEKRNDTFKPNGKSDGSVSIASDNSSDNCDVLISFA